MCVQQHAVIEAMAPTVVKLTRCRHYFDVYEGKKIFGGEHGPRHMEESREALVQLLRGVRR